MQRTARDRQSVLVFAADQRLIAQHSLGQRAVDPLAPQLVAQRAYAAWAAGLAVLDPGACEGGIVDHAQRHQPLDRRLDRLVGELLAPQPLANFGCRAWARFQKSQRGVQRFVAAFGLLDARELFRAKRLADVQALFRDRVQADAYRELAVHKDIDALRVLGLRA